jgi:hypothetical protein
MLVFSLPRIWPPIQMSDLTIGRDKKPLVANQSVVSKYLVAATFRRMPILADKQEDRSRRITWEPTRPTM